MTDSIITPDLANRVLSAEELAQLRRGFETLDRDGNGLVTLDELRAHVGAEVEVGRMLASLDIDGDGRVSLAELVLGAATRRIRAHEDRLWDAFVRADTDSTGTLDRDQIEALVRELDRDPESMRAAIEAADRDGDGRIAYAELIAALLPSSATPTAPG